ncbi:MAG: nucleotidyltransferase domain-containing protein [Deltaproteobacteria bacterium]|nr:nucleotidyltransferase domain-containing protein [Deltaproteobacteria bacterium]
MSEIPLVTQTLYAELVDQLVLWETQRSIGSLSGGFVSKEVKGKKYYYFQHFLPGGERTQTYVGQAGPEMDSLVEKYKKERPDFIADQENIQQLCAQLRAGGAITASHAHVRVLQALADAGVFRIGGVLVGTQAFAAMGNILGERWESRGIETQDVDIAWELGLALAVPELPEADVPKTLEQLKMGFFPVPPLDPRNPSTSFKVRKSALRVDILTPMGKIQSDRPIYLPRLRTAGQALKYLDYLIETPSQAALINSTGVLVNIPDPARFAFHKLVVSQERPVVEQVKKHKDLKQAALLFAVLLEKRPGDIHAAWDALTGRGSSWIKKARQGFNDMKKQYPGTPDISKFSEESFDPSQ